MLNLLVVVHIIVALLLIVLVLLQDSKGGAMGGMLGGGGGGGGSNSLLGATGATSLAAKATRIFAVVFALTSIGLTTLTSTSNTSVVDSLTNTAPAGAASGTLQQSDTPPADPAAETPGAPAEPANNNPQD